MRSVQWSSHEPDQSHVQQLTPLKTTAAAAADDECGVAKPEQGNKTKQLRSLAESSKENVDFSICTNVCKNVQCVWFFRAFVSTSLSDSGSWIQR